MEEKIRLKLDHLNEQFTTDEIKWMLDNIGNPKKEIRDHLVYKAFWYGMRNELFTRDQILYLKETTIELQLLIYDIDHQNESTLVRSFSALLLSLILSYDCKEDSLYNSVISVSDYDQIFKDIVIFFEKESDHIGYSEFFGWVHAYAHFADLLVVMIEHPYFPSDKTDIVLRLIITYFKNLSIKPIDDEEYRMAYILVSLIKYEKICLETVCEWLTTVNFTKQSNQEYYQWSSFQAFCLAVYVELDQIGNISLNLKKQLYLHILND